MTGWMGEGLRLISFHLMSLNTGMPSGLKVERRWLCKPNLVSKLIILLQIFASNFFVACMNLDTAVFVATLFPLPQG